MRLLVVLTTAVSAANFTFNATLATDLQHLFAPTPPWLGADCDTSLALPNNATLWLFGDFYRKDVLENPDGTDHANIRAFMEGGWDCVSAKCERQLAKYRSNCHCTGGDLAHGSEPRAPNSRFVE